MNGRVVAKIPIPERLKLDVALDVMEKSDCINSISFGLRGMNSCSISAGELVLRSLLRCGKIRLRLRKLSADDARFDRLLPGKATKFIIQIQDS